MTDMNKAIYRVITTKAKRDAKEAHEMVTKAGYTIEKWNGIGYVVINPTTKRKIYISESTGRRGRYTTQLHYSTYGWGKCIECTDDLLKFDFQGALDKPQNEAYYAQQRMEAELADGANRWNGKVQKLKDARWQAQYEARELARLQEQMEKLQKSIIRVTEDKVKAEMKLAEVKKELGLVK